MTSKWLLVFCGLMLALVATRAEAEEGGVRLRIAIVLDSSMSMNEQDPGQLAVVAARLLADLATPRDEVTLILFGTEARLLGREVVRDDAARERLYQGLAGADRDQWCTDYRVGLQAALDALGRDQRQGERRLVIFLTDGLFDPDRSNESYYTTDEGRAARERAARSGGFDERPCARNFNRLVQHVEPGFLEQMGELTGRFAESGVRLYTLGLGSVLNGESDESQRSREMLERLASATGGSFLAATNGDQLPQFFASIYSALVGAPVEEPREVDGGQETIEFEVLRGAERVAVVVDAAGAPDLGISVLDREGAAPSHQLRPFNVDTVGAQGYRLISMDSPHPGRYRIRRDRGALRLRIQVVQEVGLRLAIEGLPPAATDGVSPRVTVGLRSSAGEPVHLSPGFLSQVQVEMTFGPEDEAIDPRSLRMTTEAQAEVSIPALSPGRYRFGVSASHRQGLLDVLPVEATIEVIHQLEISFASSRIVFDAMAEDREELVEGVFIGLAEGSTLPLDQEFQADWSAVTDLDRAEFGPERFILGPEKRSVPVVFHVPDQQKLRDSPVSFTGKVVVRPTSSELFRGEPSWETLEVDGRIRAWDWRRYYQEYAVYIWSGVGGFFFVVLIIGFLVRKRWPKHAKLHYLDREDPTGQPTSINLARLSRSKLPFRSDRHRIGKGGRPGRTSKLTYCVFVAGGNRFQVVPGDISISYDRDSEERTARKPFSGRWEERYRLGDKYEVWLTRT